MAITQVRARLGEQWVTLTYNPATGRYEGTLTPTGTSYHQPGGYFPVTVEAANDAGQTDSLSGEQVQALRLVVRETIGPVLSIISPTPGWITTGRPVIVAEAVDEAGGSGINPASFSPPGGTLEPIPGGYRYSFSPAKDERLCLRDRDGQVLRDDQGRVLFVWRRNVTDTWSDGPHTVTVSVSDYDGNVSTVSAAYQVDTVPPWMYVRLPDAHRVVDTESAEVLVEASDGGSGVERVTIGSFVLTQPPYLAAVPLEVGENTIHIMVRDRAGLESSQDIYMIRLITDRTVSDLDTLRAMYQQGAGSWSAEERTWFVKCISKGAYNHTDMNRVNIAVDYLSERLAGQGYSIPLKPDVRWKKEDIPTRSRMTAYLQNVEAVRTAQPLYIEAKPPETMQFLTPEGANSIEKALVEVDSYFPRYFTWPSGAIQCGVF